MIDDQLIDARRATSTAEAAVRKAALRVIGEEALENLIKSAVSARASYVDAVGGLSWLIRNHAVPNGDLRPSQLVREASDSPPAYWPEAASADGGMAARLAALEGTP